MSLIQTDKQSYAPAIKGSLIFPALLILALLLTWSAMSPCLDNGFINWDESEYIINNPKIKTLSRESVKTIFSTPDLKMYSPLSTLSYALEYRAAGLNPRIYHATNILLHLLNTTLVMFFVWFLLNGVWPAFFVALFFGIHPAHVESVAWAAERKDVLYAFFYLSSLIAYILKLRGAKTYFPALALFVCALLAKPMAVTFPLALLLIDYLKSDRIGVRQWLNKTPFFALATILIAAQMSQQGTALSMHWAKRLVVPFYNLGFYIYTLLWPFDLSAMYVFAPSGKPAYYLFASAAAGIALLLWKYFRRDKEIIFGAAFFMTMLLPVLQFFPFGPVISADRYTYLSSIGIFFAGAVCARRFWRRLNPALRSMAVACVIGAVLTLAVTARVRCAVWKDGVSLWSDTLQKQPQAATALINLCGAYIQTGMNNDAKLCLSQAIRRYPENDDNYYNLGFLSAMDKEFGKAEEYFARTLSISPCHAPALNNMGNLSLIKGEAAKAEQYYTRSAQCDNGYYAAYLNLGKLALSRNDAAGAVLFYEKALRADPADKKTRVLLDVLRKAGTK